MVDKNGWIHLKIEKIPANRKKISLQLLTDDESLFRNGGELCVYDSDGRPVAHFYGAINRPSQPTTLPE